jgi:glycoprotease/Kae1 family metallohydrolase
MKILSIETSCDETAISYIEATGGYKNPIFKVLGNNVSSQIEIHKEYGGVFPAMAKREHIKNLPIVLADVLKQAKISAKNKKPIDLIAVTVGPGLEPALWTGIVFAKELAEKWDVPIMPVNHMEGHILSVLIQGKISKNKTKSQKIKFPSLALLISGGHTELVLIKDWMKYKKIGQTRDDAVGEAFDKVARMLGLPYPGGPEISKLASELREYEVGSNIIFDGSTERDGASKAIRQQANMRARENNITTNLLGTGDMRVKHMEEEQNSEGLRSATARVLSKNSAEFYADPKNFSSSSVSFLPRPMINSKDFDFSFSGLKTAVLYLIRDLKNEKEDILENINVKRAIALEFENAVTDVLLKKTLNAIKKYKTKDLIVGGGVASNNFIKESLKKEVALYDNKINVHFPISGLTTDNSLMIGIASYFNFLKKKKGVNTKNIKANGNLELK